MCESNMIGLGRTLTNVLQQQLRNVLLELHRRIFKITFGTFFMADRTCNSVLDSQTHSKFSKKKKIKKKV